MSIVVTGSTKLAGAIIENFGADTIRMESVMYGDYDYIHDVFINLAHDHFSQSFVLDFLFKEWKDNPDKLIINISSRAAFPNLSKGYMYAAQKAALDHMAQNLTFNSEKKCRITNINLGLLVDELPSLTYDEVCTTLRHVISRPKHIEIPNITLQHSHNYIDVQRQKAPRYDV